MLVTINLQFIKKQAKALKEYLKVANAGISLSSCYHAISVIYGFKDWNHFCAYLKSLESETLT